MAAKRRSAKDVVKEQTDLVHEIRERGVADVHSAKDVAAIHPMGKTEVLKHLLKNSTYTRDQSQEQRRK